MEAVFLKVVLGRVGAQGSERSGLATFDTASAVHSCLPVLPLLKTRCVCAAGMQLSPTNSAILLAVLFHGQFAGDVGEQAALPFAHPRRHPSLQQYPPSIEHTSPPPIILSVERFSSIFRAKTPLS